jgi:uncharacterized protein
MTDTGSRHSAGVVNNPAKSRYELEVEGGLAVADYHIHDNVMSITHVEVPETLRGKGVAAKVMEGVVADAKAKKLSIRPICPYAVSYMQRKSN